ncbi:hypothetical protein [Coleofasciculus sp. H7-2]|uniref:hypothetical protein n=1 Tax=Coleofasciculus sp. H7-2 TaxID=3351545 RepID=UPI00366F5A14
MYYHSDERTAVITSSHLYIIKRLPLPKLLVAGQRMSVIDTVFLLIRSAFLVKAPTEADNGYWQRGTIAKL